MLLFQIFYTTFVADWFQIYGTPAQAQVYKCMHIFEKKVYNMVKKTLINLTLVALLPSFMMLAPSCSETENFGTGNGRIVSSLSADNSVTESTAVSRAAGSSAMEPALDSFALKIEKEDGSFSKTWDPVSSFDPMTNFATGSYNVSASFGALETEGFDCPYYYGETKVTVYDSETAEANIVATLANTMVSVHYTEAFKKYFSSYSTVIHSNGGAYVEFVQDESRIAYVRPGEISMELDLTKTTGKNFKLNPASIPGAKPRTHYKINFDVNGGAVGDAKLVITFDETTVTEPVEINLSDDLINAPAPTVTAGGFDPAAGLQVMEGEVPANTVKMNLIAMAGFKEVTLTTVSDYLIGEGWPAEVDLVNATSVHKAVFERMGFDASSLWKNLDKMAVLDFNNLVSKIRPTGASSEHSFTVKVVDKFTKTSEAVTLKLTVTKVNLTLSNPRGLALGGTEMTIDAAYNGKNFASNVKFVATDHYGKLIECPVKKTVDNGDGTYTVTLTVPASNEPLKIKAVYKDICESAPVTANRQEPQYTIAVNEVDVWPNNATFSFDAIGLDVKMLTDYAVVYVKEGAGQYSKTASVVKDANQGRITVKGLKPGTQYGVKVAMSDVAEPAFSNEITFTTEAAAAVPNGDFETIAQTVQMSNMNMSGRWSPTIAAPYYQNTTSFTVSEPEGWASVNAKTCNNNAKNKNTWFVIPSTYATNLVWTGTCPGIAVFGGGGSETPATYRNLKAQNGTHAMVVRNVAWDENGTDPVEDKSRGGSGNYFSRNVPTIANRSAGKLFLGSYSYESGVETYTEGAAFTSRPSALKGFYMYKNDSHDTAESGMVTVSILSGETVIATGSASLRAAADYTEFNVPLTYSNKTMKATTLKIMIASSDHASAVQSEETAAIKTSNFVAKYESSSYGAQLTVDNLTFIY